MNTDRLQSQRPPRPALQRGIWGSLTTASVAAYNFLAHDFEDVPDRYRDETAYPTRLSRAGSSIRLGQAHGRNNYPLKPPAIRKRTWQKDENGELHNKSYEDAQFSQYDEARGGQDRNPFDNLTEVENQYHQHSETEEPFSIYSKKQKWTIIVIIGLAGLFSGLSSNIYNPSLDVISRELKASASQVSLTITSYLVMQAITPLLWGPLSDLLGRRPTYIASFAVYIVGNVALSFSPNLAVLLIFRGVQASGSSSTVSIGNGVMQDIAPHSERGAFISFYQAIRNFSTAFGPVMGGALANSFGFRSVFIFLLIVSSLILTTIVLFLPETLRSIAGNGSLRLTGVHKPLYYYIKEPKYIQDPDGPLVLQKITVYTFLRPFRLFKEKDLVINLVWGGVIYAIWNMVTTSTTPLFKANFGLNELLLGVAFIPNGFGTIAGSVVAAKTLTRDYKSVETRYKETHNIPYDEELSPMDIPPDFPLEQARLQRLPWMVFLFVASLAGYGYSLSYPRMTALPGWIALPLTMQFLIAASANAMFALNQTIISDLCPGQGASATAVNNLVRCGLAALGVAFTEQMLNAVGPGTAFLSLGMAVIAVSPIQVVNQFWGPLWRAQREMRRPKMNAIGQDRQKA
ncbi:major facilitator superfamily transporter [Colletotrichum graminicola]|uniref:Major facilitator superfamily transporter n=1 Tax=Colletotrichum graminicola (strain M1.001 / M2 / FGSC 10212) TaxID=645133 RepID=E3Q557_COLGM|nr:major facilitator superfamily transporter [Colletotrichum graminicola M1.001]EFQ25824.1 major facilitator superfamily transporter [Colletotrichum graminicola M1.001]WDK22932.1 major facilitator superfamily transporter [Colletotrichum graminicola]